MRQLVLLCAYICCRKSATAPGKVRPPPATFAAIVCAVVPQGAPAAEVRANLFSMDSSTKPAAPAEPPPPPPTVRVLVPSPIGPLGLALAGLSVVRLQVAMKPAVLEEFKPLGRGAPPPEVDEVIGRLAEYFSGVRRRLD